MPIDAAAAIAKDLRLECPKPCIPGAIPLAPSDYHNLKIENATKAVKKIKFRRTLLNAAKKIEEAVAERDAALKIADSAVRNNLRIENYALQKNLPVKAHDYNGIQMISYLRDTPDQSDLVREAALENVANLYELCQRSPIPASADFREIATGIIAKKCVYTAPLFSRLVTQVAELPDVAIGSSNSYAEIKAALQPLIDRTKEEGNKEEVKQGIGEPPRSAPSPSQPLDVPVNAQPVAPSSARGSLHIDMQLKPRSTGKSSTGKSITRPLLR